MSDKTESNKGMKRHYELDAEYTVLAAILSNPEIYDSLKGLLLAKYFYKKSHQLIFSYLEQLIQSNQVGFDGLKDCLLQDGQLNEECGEDFVQIMKRYVNCPVNIEEQTLIIQSKYLTRKFLATFEKMISCVDNGEDALEHFYKAEEKFDRLCNEMNLHQAPIEMAALMSRVHEGIQSRCQSNKSNEGVSTGYKDIDDMTHGLHRGDLIVVGTRSSKVRTSWLINLANNIATHRNESIVAFFTLGSMSEEILGTRMLSVEARVGVRDLYSGQLTNNDRRRVEISSGLLADANINISNGYYSSVYELQKTCQWLKRQAKGLDLILVDYFQLIGGKECVNNREQQRHDIMQALKNLAKCLDVPVVVASQLNIELNIHERYKPMIQDFNEVFAIEQYADMVMLLHKMFPSEMPNSKYNMEAIIVKNNNGEVGTVKLTYIDQYSRFEN